MRYLTLGYLSFAALPPADLVDLAAQSGFRSVGIRITGRYKSDAYTPIAGHAKNTADIARRLQVNGIRLSNISAYYLTPDISADDLAPIVDTASALGASLIIANRHDPDDNRYIDLMQAYCDLAARASIRLAVEVMRYSETKCVADAVRAIQRVNRDNFGLLADPLHLSRAGDSPAALRGVPAGRIFLAQLCDAKSPAPATLEGIVAEARGGRVNPGDGDLPLYDFLDALPDDIEIECEVPRSDAAHLPPLERAHDIERVCRSYLDGYRLARRPGFSFT